jgi:HTH-type transcriptional regulator/antitoxin HigA
MPSKFQPNWVSPPGETVLDILAERSITQEEFARSFGEPRMIVDAFLRGHLELTARHAKRLEAIFGTPHTFWLSREEQYRKDIARAKSSEDRAMSLQWLSELPLKDMVKLGWLKVAEDAKPTVNECLDFFGVRSIPEWRDEYQRQISLASFRTSNAFSQHPSALAAWLRKGELEGHAQICEEWDVRKFQDSFDELRKLTRKKDPSQFLPILRNICATSGVAVVVARAPNGCRASGAARFLSPKKALILLSFRHLSDDHFWFTFFHEVGHLVLHKQSEVFVDGLETESNIEEEEANQFSQQLLVPAKFLARLNSLQLAPIEVLRFAKEIGVSPGIVIGQIQNSGRVDHSRYNAFKQKYRWEDIDKYLSTL